MKSLFSTITRLAIRFRAITLVLVAVVIALGVIAITQLQQELIPPIEFPQTIILAEASGMTSEQVLTVLTNRLEAELDQIEDVVNLESTTTGAFGSVIIARNEFGIDQERLRGEIQEAVDRVWLPVRRIEPRPGQDPQRFAAALLNDMTAEVLLYLGMADPNFFFQLTPETWATFSDETVQTVLTYLATQVERREDNASALRLLVEQDLSPGLRELELVASVSVSGGQALPGEGAGQAAPAPAPTMAQRPLLLNLSAEVWAVVSRKAGFAGELNANSAAALGERQVTAPDAPPPLPAGWQMDRFVDASDLLEMETLTQSVADVFDTFRETGRIVGALGATDDLTPETVRRLLEIEPTLVEALEAEHLAALPDAVFAALPDEYIAGLDGFTRDELAAAALAQRLTGQSGHVAPVELPGPWRLQPPELISFSFADLPLASFSVFAEGEFGAGAANPGGRAASPPAAENTAPTAAPAPAKVLPQGPPLPPVFALLGAPFGIELNTADDLINIQLPPQAAQQFGLETLSAADFFNFLFLLNNPDSLPPEVEAPSAPIDVGVLIATISPEAINFIARNDATFARDLSAPVFGAFSDDVLALAAISPPLDALWATLANQPQLEDMPLRTADDVLALGDGSASQVLNTIDAGVPERFAGYEVRLFNNLTPGIVRYFALNEPGFFANLEPGVMGKLAPEVLRLLPQDVLDSLDPQAAAALNAIAAGEQPSAAEALSALYATSIPPADPEAPAINRDWEFIGNFYSIELDSADDFFRYPENFPFEDTSAFMNSFFESAQGTNFAPNLFGGLTLEAVVYMLDRDPAILDELRVEALALMPDDVVAVLPDRVRERAEAGAQPFKPTDTVTRTNGAPSLLLTVFKARDANTVEAFADVDAILQALDAENENISIAVAFEQASFIEESISGVAREGGLGAVFAIDIILIFLSGGRWRSSPRRFAGVLLMVLFIGLLLAAVVTQIDSAYDFESAFSAVDVTLRILFILGAAGGFLVLVWPGGLPYPAWRSTIVIGVSIPLSILTAFVLMRWFAPAVHDLLNPLSDSSGVVTFLLRLFPERITLNIMTLSGLTVAIGRVVDDSIVVLENSFRQIQEGGDRREAIITATRDVSVAIFSATLVTMVIFLPLGLTGGVIGAFFVPFGLAVTYALAASYIIAIAVVPVLTDLFISADEAEAESSTFLARIYLPPLHWSLKNWGTRLLIIALALISMFVGFALFSARPAAFLPDFGEPQIDITVDMPPGTRIIETNTAIERMEAFIGANIPAGDVTNIQTVVGTSTSDLQSFIVGSSSIAENTGQITIGLASAEARDRWTARVREEAEAIFGENNVSVSGTSAGSGGFGAFALVVSGPEETLAELDPLIIETLNNVEGITNVSSNLTQAAGATRDGLETIIRIDRESALQYTGELETDDTLGVTQLAKEAVQALPQLPDTVTVDEGFDSRQQTEGFQSLFVAMGIALVIVIIILIVTFRSLVLWLGIIFSIIVAPVGAAIALTVTDRVLGISAMIGLLMLIGIVVTNAVVLIDRVQANRRERGMEVREALLEAGERRLRPILMTALTAIIALIPLAVGLSDGAIIASELGTVVIGGLVSSTFLTLIVVPVAYSLLDSLRLPAKRDATSPQPPANGRGGRLFRWHRETS